LESHDGVFARLLRANFYQPQRSGGRGIVEDADYEPLRQKIMDELAATTDPANGEKILGSIFRKEDIYTGRSSRTLPTFPSFLAT